MRGYKLLRVDSNIRKGDVWVDKDGKTYPCPDRWDRVFVRDFIFRPIKAEKKRMKRLPLKKVIRHLIYKDDGTYESVKNIVKFIQNNYCRRVK